MKPIFVVYLAIIEMVHPSSPASSSPASSSLQCLPVEPGPYLSNSSAAHQLAAHFNVYLPVEEPGPIQSSHYRIRKSIS